MTAHPHQPSLRRRKVPQINLNTALLILTLITVVLGLFKILLPLAVVPDRVEAIDAKVTGLTIKSNDLQRGQDVQGEALRTLVEVARDTKETRRDVDRATIKLQDVERRLDKLEGK